MAAAITVTAGTSPLTNATVSGTGFTAAVGYDVLIAHPGGQIATRTVTTDGAGAFSLTFTPQGRGNYSVTAIRNPSVVVATSATTYIHSDN